MPRCAAIASPVLPLTLSRLASSASSDPNSVISLAAVLIPIPRTPGTLSTGSPMSANMSTTWSGRTPFESKSSSTPSVLSDCGSKRCVRSSTSCPRSLSRLTILISRSGCSRRMRRTTVAMVSSASTSATASTGTDICFKSATHRSTCGCRSSGAGLRFALYSG